jgi:hypothetical protein
VAVALLIMSIAAGFDGLFAAGLLPHSALWDPMYFAIAMGCYFTLGTIALFTIVPSSERPYVAPIVPLYLIYTLIHVVPMSIGFLNWISVGARGHRLYRDHYEPLEDTLALQKLHSELAQPLPEQRKAS